MMIPDPGRGKRNRRNIPPQPPISRSVQLRKFDLGLCKSKLRVPIPVIVRLLRQSGSDEIPGHSWRRQLAIRPTGADFRVFYL